MPIYHEFRKKAALTFHKVRNQARSSFLKHPYHKHLFILCPPYCGSTALHELISTSKQVSTNHPFGTREGQKLPELRELLSKNEKYLQGLESVPWVFVKKIWDGYWDHSKKMLLDKSPPNIFYGKEIESVFKPAYFIIVTRDPFAQCEGLIRRHKSHQRDYKNAAKFAIEGLKAQDWNLRNLHNAVWLPYETFTENPEKAQKTIGDLLPELKDMNMGKKIKSHNYQNHVLALKNMNDEKYERLTTEQITALKEYFSDYQLLLENFGYRLT